MTDPKPLFADESEAWQPVQPGPRHGIEVERLDLDPVAVAPQAARVTVSAVGGGELSALNQAMDRGMARFPAIMQSAGYLVRNNLNQLLPLDYEKLAVFGSLTLERSAFLIGELTGVNERLHEVDAEAIITRVVQSARAHAARNRQVSFIAILSNLAPFDTAAAEQQVAGVQRALLLRLDQVTATSEAMQRLRTTLSVEITTLAILEDMSDHGAMGELLTRRSLLFKASLQELAAALAQMESMKRQLQDWTMRCDEVKAVTLPALGYTASL
jgi:hypothetical protein